MRATKIYPFILILSLVSGFGYNTQAGELVNPQLGAVYVKLTDGTKSFSLSLSARIDDNRVKIENGPLAVYAVNESGKTLLGTVNTNRSGKAVLNVKPAILIPRDKEGYFNFEVQYAGNSAVNKATANIHVQDVSLAMSFSEKDTMKTVRVNVSAINDKGINTVVRGVPVEFYIKRLFCLYRFGGEKTDSAGFSTAELPRNMPGDSAGQMIVVAKILENDNYGTVETERVYSGAKALVIEQKPRRGLGDTDAPLWMVYTLLVLLSGVWLHVLYVIWLVIRINIMGKKALREGV